ncbi:endonuclease domain-containing protein [Streptomyces griseofuscus]|uniref:endonuclease domain-containing protein n=1 Tax=Streptomyces griseofuscus TaxID=146922 RepID=UPI0033FFEAC3
MGSLRELPRGYEERTRQRPQQECSFDGCGNRASSGGLCSRHARQLERRGTLRPVARIRRVGAARTRDEEGRKRCGMCMAWRPEGDYGASRATSDGLQTYCVLCVRLTRYNLTPDAYAALLEAQEGVCAICRQPDAAGKDLAVDHDHGCCHATRSCGRCVRGLLCTQCNLGVGRLKDDPERLRVAARYVRTWAALYPRDVPDAPPQPRDRRWYEHKVTPDGYAAALEAQGGACAICHRAPGRRALAVDRSRTCCPPSSTACGRCTRGLLCANCVVGLSNFGDDADRMVRAAEYLGGA